MVDRQPYGTEPAPLAHNHTPTCTTWLPFWSRTQRSVCSVSSSQMDTRASWGSTCSTNQPGQRAS